MKKISFGQQILFSFGAIAFAFIVASYIVQYHTKKLTNSIERVEQLRLPTAQASQNLSRGISQSLAALRGWLILADPQFKVEREEVWLRRIDPALDQLSILSKKWTNQDDIVRLEDVRLELEIFKRAQEEIVDISHTIDATPAKKFLLKMLSPLQTLC